MGKAISLAAAAYKLVWLRLALFFVLPFITVFLSETEDYSEAAWRELGTFRMTRIFMKASFPGLMSIAAFYDNSVTAAKARHKELKEAAAAEEIENMKPEEAP